MLRAGNFYCGNGRAFQRGKQHPPKGIANGVAVARFKRVRDKLILAVWTDGRLTPDDALLQASAILRHHLDVFVNFNEDVIEFDETPAGVSEENMKLKKLLNMSVNEIELSVRAANCLNNANITTVGQLAQKTEAEMLKYRNFGKKSLNEIKDKLTALGLGLGMKFDPGLVETPVGVDVAASSNGAGTEQPSRVS